VKPDAVDIRILDALMKDGRASHRQIARRTSLTTPTVSARIARMRKAGMIKKFVPILSASSINGGIFALIALKVDSSSAQKLAKDLAKVPEVENIYSTTGQGMTLKVALDDVAALQEFLGLELLARPGVSIASSQIITSVVKEEPAPFSPSMLTMDLKCDYCHDEVTRPRPYTTGAGATHYYFCCKTCKGAYLDKFGSRLAKMKRN
jgi:DNA-binding Lrp family transcriptional regulator